MAECRGLNKCRPAYALMELATRSLMQANDAAHYARHTLTEKSEE
jgi:hypothetical protein